MSTITDTTSGFAHVMSVILDDLECGVKDLAIAVEKEWPTIEDLLKSGQIGKDILKYLAMLEPVLSVIEFVFPTSRPIIDWATNIIEQLAALKAFNTPCACPACTK